MRDAFKEKKFLTDPELIHKEYTYGVEQLQILQRQVHVGRPLYRVIIMCIIFLLQVQLSQMFAQSKLVVERTTLAT